MAPANIGIIVVGVALLLTLPKRYALIPILVCALYTTLSQAFVIGGVNFFIARIFIVCASLRVIVRREAFGIKPHAIDGVFLAWLLTTSFVYVIFDGKYVPVSERLGYFSDVFCSYLVTRSLITTFDDVLFTMKACAFIVLPLSVLFVLEHVTGENPFSVLGAPLMSAVRNGRVRAQGPFKHAILAGTFGATSVPLFVGLWVNGHRWLSSAAIVAALAIVAASASNGPVMALGIGCLGIGLWPLRRYMRLVRWGLATTVIALHIVMKQPVWFIIDRIGGLVGGESWYRAALIDSTIRHVDEWWLVGTGYTAHWMATGIQSNSYSADLVNEFVVQAVHGGVLALGLFVWLIVTCFRAAGVVVRDADSQRQSVGFVGWSLGCVLATHITSFFSVTYFDQMLVFWCLLIAMCAVLASSKVSVPATVVRRTGPVAVKRQFEWRPAGATRRGYGPWPTRRAAHRGART